MQSIPLTLILVSHDTKQIQSIPLTLILVSHDTNKCKVRERVRIRAHKSCLYLTHVYFQLGITLLEIILIIALSNSKIHETSGSHGDEYEHSCLLVRCTMPLVTTNIHQLYKYQ
jgi:hypothetical protein